jgi:Tol biopolymer transport system component
MIALAGCHSASYPFGIFFRSNLGGIEIGGVNLSYNLYRIPNISQPRIQQLTFMSGLGVEYYLASKTGDEVVLGKYNNKYAYLLDVNSMKTEDITNRFHGPFFSPLTFPVDWSPDQKRFAILSNEGGFPSIMDFDGSNVKSLNFPSFGEPPRVGDMQWSPDGKELAISRSTDIQKIPVLFAIFVYDLSSKKLTQLTSYDAGCSLPIWSPTGQQIVATCSYKIRILSVLNSNQYYEASASGPCRDPAWSPDGKQISFICEQGNNQDKLFTMNSDGKRLHELRLGNVDGPAFLSDPIWSPNGTQIIYVAGAVYPYTKIYSVNIDGSNNHPLTPQVADYEDLSIYPVP